MGEVVSADGDGGVLLRVKAVPGASRDQIAGPLGDRLKVRVSAPPEGGKANDAIIRLLSSALGVGRSQIELVSGGARAEKVLRLRGLNIQAVQELIRRGK